MRIILIQNIIHAAKFYNVFYCCTLRSEHKIQLHFKARIVSTTVEIQLHFSLSVSLTKSQNINKTGAKYCRTLITYLTPPHAILGFNEATHK